MWFCSVVAREAPREAEVEPHEAREKCRDFAGQ
jgi:hypothetical protein